MKTSFLSALALPALFLTTFAAPTTISDVAIHKRQIADATSIVEQLYADVQQYTGAINTTAAGLNADSSILDNTTATASFITNVNAITALITAATAQTDLLAPAGSLARRQTDTALAALVENLLLEISGALNGIVATLGLSALLSSLNPLVASLSALLLSLKDVVDNLLTVVEQLVDGLLVGLSVGLAGLVL